jgi:hypothetical protein
MDAIKKMNQTQKGLERAIEMVKALPIHFLFSSQNDLSLIFENNGRIVWILNSLNMNHQSDMVHLLKTRNIFDLFHLNASDLNESKAAAEIISLFTGRDPNEVPPVAISRFASRNRFENEFVWSRFTTHLPVSYLHVIQSMENHFFGLIRFERFIPNLMRYNDDISVILDTADRLIGYNDCFARQAGLQQDALGEPLSRFIDTDFRQQQLSFKDDTQTGKELFRYSGPNKKPERFALSAAFFENEHGIHHEARDIPLPAFLMIAQNIDFSGTQDYRLEVHCRDIRTAPPFIILNGDLPGKGVWPDRYGLFS